MTPRKHSSIIWLLVLFGLVALFFSPALSRTFMFRDAFNLFYPYKAVEASFLKHFSVCLWNHYEVLGSSFVGELATGWFYPGNFLFMVLPVEPAFRAFILLHFFLAALFMWLWLSGLGLKPWARCAGALGYTLSGYVLSQNGMPDMLVAAAWLPGSMWLLHRYLSRESLSSLILFGVSLAMPFLAGRAEAALITLAASAFWILAYQPRGGEVVSRVKTLAVAFFVGGSIALFISMVQLLPSYELGRLSVKGGGFDLDTAQLWSLHPYRLLEFVLPFPWGRFWPKPDYLGAELTGWSGRYPWAISHYLGLPMLVGAGAAFFLSKWRARLLIGGGLCLVVLFSLGRYAYVYEAVYRVFPPFRIFRYPEKWMLLAALILSSTGAFGLSGLAERLAARGGKRTVIGAGALALAFLGAVILMAFLFKTSGMKPIGGLMPAALFKKQLIHAGAVLLALALAGALGSMKRGSANLIGGAFLIILALDLNLANREVIPYAEPGIYREEPRLLSLIYEHAEASGYELFDKQGRPRPGTFRLMREPIEASEWELSSFAGGSTLEKHRRWELHTLMPNFNFLWGIEELTGYTAAVTADYDRLMRAGPWLTEFEIFNVRYLLLPSKRPAKPSERLKFAGSAAEFGYNLYELPMAFPRAYLVGKSLRRADPMTELSRLKNHDFKRAVILADDPRLPPWQEDQELGLTPATIVEYRPELVRIRANAPVPAYLVLSDSYYPGWRAEVDGKPTPVFKANFLVRAVWLPEGEHEVVFRYRPGLYRIGRLLSSAAGIMVILMLIAIANRKFGKKDGP